MERRRSEETSSPSPSVNGSSITRAARARLQPNYNSKTVQEALEHLASIDLIELCNEAKVEHCRATRDLRSCGRYVQHVLNSCGHASLCAECSQRCDLCPICRIPIPKNGNRLRLRLYCECIEAGLIPKRYDDRFQEKEDGEQLTADVQRLYSLFDVAMENNLVSLICYYVTDVCMDESAVSSDPVVAFLLDEVVVKDWCKRTFGHIIVELQGIYILGVEEMKTRMDLLLKFSGQLTGISNVLEVLDSSFKGTVSAQLHELNNLQENVLKAKQHLETMTWCIRHQFLENIRSRYSSFTSWRSLIRERKSAAIKRSWPGYSSAESTRQDESTLFIEDALSNLEIEQGMGEELDLKFLHKDGGSPSFLRSKIEGVAGCYPFENLRSASDMLFLHGSADLVVAKRAIFLYYLFDRHWTMPEEKWRCVVDDFAATFGVTRHSLLESLTFYLLDDHTDMALQEACHLLPEIAGPETHPKIAQVLLERQNPDAALMVLRWSGHDDLCGYANSEHGGAQLVSLGEAVTAVRVRIECGLLTEAFMYQRSHCMKLKEEKLKHGSSPAHPNDSKDKFESWVDRMEALVTEICCLCIRRNLIDRMIELPWDFDEEKYLHKCLFEYATENPSTTSGSLLVVFYLQRYRYIEAYQVDRKLQSLEQDFIKKFSISEAVLSRMRSTGQWRTGLVDKCIELLPEIQKHQVKSGSLPDFVLSPTTEVENHVKSVHSEKEPNSTSLLVSLSTDSSFDQMDNNILSKNISAFKTPVKSTGLLSNSHFDLSNKRPPSNLHGRFLTALGGPSTSHNRNNTSTHIPIMNLKFDDVPTPGFHLPSPQNNTPFKEVNRSSSRILQNNHLRDYQFDKASTIFEPNGFLNQMENSHRLSSNRVISDTVNSPSSIHGLLKDSAPDEDPTFSSKRVPFDRPWSIISSYDPMDVSWSHGSIDSAVKMKMNGGPRWRSDESSGDEEKPSPERFSGRTRVRGTKSRGFARR